MKHGQVGVLLLVVLFGVGIVTPWANVLGLVLAVIAWTESVKTSR